MTARTHSLTPQALGHVEDWLVSSYSGNGNNCVEIANLMQTPHHGIAVRDSKNPNGPALLLTPDSFTALITTVRNHH